MTLERLQINVINAVWAGASGAAADIDEAIADADANIYGPGPEDDAADFGFSATSAAITDAATVNGVDFEIRVLDDGTAGTAILTVELLIGGTSQGSTTINPNSSLTNHTISLAGWDSDWTKAELDGAELRLTPSQSGMPGTNAVDIDCAELIIDYTAVAGPTWDQDRYRAINDDGTETGSTFKAALDTPWMQLIDENVRVRFTVQETSGTAATEGFQLQRRLNGGAWGDVNGTSTIVRSSNSPESIEDGDDTTERLAGAQTYLTDAGGTNGYDDVSGLVGTAVFAASEEAEYEFCVQLRSADTKYGDKVELRLVLDGGGVLDTYTSIPVMHADAAAAVLRSGGVQKFTVSFASGDTSKTHTFATALLDIDSTFLVYGVRGNEGAPAIALVDGAITSTTAAVFSRETSGSALEIIGYVCEFTDGVRVERGTITDATFDAAASALVTIELQNIGDIAQAFTLKNIIGVGAGVTYDIDDLFSAWISEAVGVASVNAQTSDVDTADHDLNWEVIQYAGLVVKRGSNTSMGTTSVSVTEALSPVVDVDKTFVNINFQGALTAASIQQRMLRARHTINSVSGDQITITRDAHGSEAIADIRWEVVEFADSTVVQEVLEAFPNADGQEDDNTLNAVSADAFVIASSNMMQGETAFSTDDIIGVSSFTAEMTTSTNLQSKRTATGDTADVAFYVVDFTPVTGTTITVGLATETDTALGVGLGIGLDIATETDTALPVTANRSRTLVVGIATDTETALPVVANRSRTLVVGLASETDTALGIGFGIGLGIATETDTALAVVINRLRTLVLTLPSETDTALPVGLKIGLDIAIETDTALPVTVFNPKFIVLTPATETDTALPVAALLSKIVVVGIATETDTALSVGLALGLGLAIETDTALAVVANRSRTLAVGLASETDTAFAVTFNKTRRIVLTIASETDTALNLLANKKRVFTIATETDTALPVTLLAAKIVPVGIATETDTVLAVAHPKAVAHTPATETDTALAVVINRARAIVVTIPVETDTVLPVIHTRAISPTIATETDTALPVTIVGAGPAIITGRSVRMVTTLRGINVEAPVRG